MQGYTSGLGQIYINVDKIHTCIVASTLSVTEDQVFLQRYSLLLRQCICWYEHLGIRKLESPRNCRYDCTINEGKPFRNHFIAEWSPIQVPTMDFSDLTVAFVVFGKA